jgi:DNA (cytosine-5)-methyltransferase 1
MQLVEEIQPIFKPERDEQRTFTSLELFAGAGGLALGTHAAGFRHLGLIEWDMFAAETLRNNSQRVLGLASKLVFHCDARTVNYNQFAGQVDLLTDGPPCQPFSSGGLANGSEDERDMFPLFLHAVAKIMPNAILIENVKGLLRPKFREYFSYILKRLQFPLCHRKQEEERQDHYKRLFALTEKDFPDEEQYVVTHQYINTADYGVPQIRERVIITAFRRDLGTNTFHLDATHSKEALLLEQWVTGSYWEKHNIPSYDCPGPSDRKLIKKLQYQPLLLRSLLPWSTTCEAIDDLPPPVERGCKEKIPNHVQHPGARIYPGHSGSLPDQPAKALKAGVHGTPGGENVLYDPATKTIRYFTAREAARLQTFPDTWHFHGSWGACMKQLGNAVPAEVIKLFAQEISKRLANALT